MIKKNELFTLSILCLLFLNSCSGVTGTSKTESNDEFLVQKKSPLLMPPDFNELPNPKLEVNSEVLEKNSEIKELITGSGQSNDVLLDQNKPSENFEKLFLEKIKKN